MFRFLPKVIIAITLIVIFLNNTSAHISIDLDPEELQRLGEILVQSYFEHNLLSNRAISQCKKITNGIYQSFGIMVSLVGANLITNMLQPYMPVGSIMQESYPASIVHSTFKPTDNCDYEFGCDSGLCWRACDNTFNISHSWCFSSPKIQENNFQPCTFPHDCSPCWDCLSLCNIPKM